MATSNYGISQQVIVVSFGDVVLFAVVSHGGLVWARSCSDCGPFVVGCVVAPTRKANS